MLKANEEIWRLLSLLLTSSFGEKGLSSIHTVSISPLTFSTEFSICSVYASNGLISSSSHEERKP